MIKAKPAKNNHIYVRRQDIVLRQLGEMTFLADQENDNLFSLNELGNAVWNLLERPHTQSQILDVLLSAFPDADKDQVQKDVTQIILKLEQNNLVHSN